MFCGVYCKCQLTTPYEDLKVFYAVSPIIQPYNGRRGRGIRHVHSSYRVKYFVLIIILVEYTWIQNKCMWAVQHMESQYNITKHYVHSKGFVLTCMSKFQCLSIFRNPLIKIPFSLFFSSCFCFLTTCILLQSCSYHLD